MQNGAQNSKYNDNILLLRYKLFNAKFILNINYYNFILNQCPHTPV